MIFVSKRNLAEEDLQIKWMGRPVLRRPASLLPQLFLPLPSGLMDNVAVAVGNKVTHGLKYGLPLCKASLPLQLPFTFNLQAHHPVWHHFTGITDTLDMLPSGKGWHFDFYTNRCFFACRAPAKTLPRGFTECHVHCHGNTPQHRSA